MASDAPERTRWAQLRLRLAKDEGALSAAELRELKRFNKRFLPSRANYNRPQVLSYGGGLDSFCMLLDAVKRGQPPDAIVFADVGDPAQLGPGEWPETYDHILTQAAPVARENGIPFYWLTGGEPPRKWKRRFAAAGITWETYPIRGGGADESASLIEWLEYEGKSGERVQLPVKGPARSCTTVAKVERFEKWMNDHYPDEVVDVWIGFETGEESRAIRGDPFSMASEPEAGETHRVNFFPLIHGALPRTRGECRRLIQGEGKQVPTKSACVFCPYAKQGPWREFARRDPAGFVRIEALEKRKLDRPTGRGYRLSIQGWGKFSLSPSMHGVLLKLLRAQRTKHPIYFLTAEPGARRDMLRRAKAGDRRARQELADFDARHLVGGDWQSLQAMMARQWVAEDGKLTQYGKDILKEAGPTRIGGATDEERKEQAELVWRAATKRGELPVPDVHYVFTPIGEYAACRLSSEEDALETAQGEWRLRKNPEVRRLRNRLMR